SSEASYSRPCGTVTHFEEIKIGVFSGTTMRTTGTEVVRDRGTTRAPSPLHAFSPAPRAFPERGFSLPELLLVVAILGISALVAMAAWNNFLRKSEAMSAARLTQKYLSQARMLSVYRGVYH